MDAFYYTLTNGDNGTYRTDGDAKKELERFYGERLRQVEKAPKRIGEDDE